MALSGFVFFVLAAFCAPIVHAETLAEAVRAALAWQPELRASAASRRAAAEGVAEARGGYLPALDLTLGRGRERSDNASTRPGEVSLNRSEAELTVSQLVFDTGAVSSQVRRSEARSEGAALLLASASEVLAFRTAQAYLEVLRLTELMAIAQENVAAHERTLRQVGILAEGGVGRRADVLQAAARLAQAQTALASLQGQLEQAGSGYRHLVGRAPRTLLAPNLERKLLPERLEPILEQTLAAHPAVRAAERERDAALADREFARSRLGPRVSLELGMTHNRDLDGLRGLNAEAIAMLRLRQNLFRGGSDEARIRQAEARVDEANAGLARARNDVERDLRQAHEGLRAERERQLPLAVHARTSAEVVEAYRAQFRLGQRSLLDLLNAEAENFNARANQASGRSALLAAGYRTLAAMGRLLDALGVALPAEAAVEGARR